jgi:hypothetical protein
LRSSDGDTASSVSAGLKQRCFRRFRRRGERRLRRRGTRMRRGATLHAVGLSKASASTRGLRLCNSLRSSSGHPNLSFLEFLRLPARSVRHTRSHQPRPRTDVVAAVHAVGRRGRPRSRLHLHRRTEGWSTAHGVVRVAGRLAAGGAPQARVVPRRCAASPGGR